MRRSSIKQEEASEPSRSRDLKKKQLMPRRWHRAAGHSFVPPSAHRSVINRRQAPSHHFTTRATSRVHGVHGSRLLLKFPVIEDASTDLLTNSFAGTATARVLRSMLSASACLSYHIKLSFRKEAADAAFRSRNICPQQKEK